MSDAEAYDLSELPKFGRLLSGGSPKDADVVITEEGREQTAGRKRPHPTDSAEEHPGIIVPCHQVVLYSLSSFFQSKLDRWSNTEVKDSGRKQLQLIVPPGQQELGQRLITAMYADQPDLSDLSPLQLVQLALLAESYDVSKVVAAAARALGQLPHEQFTADLLHQVMALPDSCWNLKCFERVRTKAREQLQQEFGDLEGVWVRSAKVPQLLQLPFAAILQLVQDSRTAVMSEDTVVYTLRRWLEEHPNTSQAQRKQLADTVRLPLCTATFLSSCSAVAWLLEAGYTHRELRMACLLQGTWQLKWEEGIDPGTWAKPFEASRAAWQCGPRPEATWRSVGTKWTVPLADVRSLVQQESDNRDGVMAKCGKLIWQGREFQLYLKVSTHTDKQHYMGLYVQAVGDTCASLSLTLRACRTLGEPLLQRFIGCMVGECGWQTLLPLPEPPREWAVVEAALQQKQLVHADGCLHLEALLTRIE